MSLRNQVEGILSSLSYESTQDSSGLALLPPFGYVVVLGCGEGQHCNNNLKASEFCDV
uniref:Uncharacterized protein n=1 Tax=Physcomitrium patens TaxID=3218 RepID=A0A2K1JCM1_PHYPA|nr:hypothetical protein PHYPA_019558 [Physcomitrium patens]